MKKIMLVMLPLVLLLAGCAASAGSASDPTGSVRTTRSAAQPAVAPKTSTRPAPSASKVLEADGWQVAGNSLKSSLGNWGGTIRITNTADHVRSALITVTILPPDGEDPVATLSGAVNHVGAGKTATTNLISADAYRSMKYRLALDVTSIDS